ncbi:MAG: molybdenum cofactor guanylyltransferase [Chloroflexi bacterium]|nr:molybdenum cofactor guanylyltransferase [Chloroflexota bacterium]
MTGIVLAGGQSARLGRNKALEPIGGRLLLHRVLDRLAAVCAALVVVVRDEDWVSPHLAGRPARVVPDVYPGLGALAGIFAGLQAARHEYTFACACDMPFLSSPLIQFLQSLASGFDVVIPVVGGREEPMHAVYSKRCQDPMEKRLCQGGARVIDFFPDVRVRYVAEDEIRGFDPHLLSFFNVNTPADLERALALAAADPTCRTE